MIEIFFWVILLIWLVFGVYRERGEFIANGLAQFILFVLIGLTIFDNPLTK